MANGQCFVQEFVARVLVNEMCRHNGLPDLRRSTGRQSVAVDGKSGLQSWHLFRTRKNAEVEGFAVILVNRGLHRPGRWRARRATVADLGNVTQSKGPRRNAAGR